MSAIENRRAALGPRLPGGMSAKPLFPCGPICAWQPVPQPSGPGFNLALGLGAARVCALIILHAGRCGGLVAVARGSGGGPFLGLWRHARLAVKVTPLPAHALAGSV